MSITMMSWTLSFWATEKGGSGEYRQIFMVMAAPAGAGKSDISSHLTHLKNRIIILSYGPQIILCMSFYYIFKILVNFFLI